MAAGATPTDTAVQVESNMDITPTVRVDRFAQIAPGDICILDYDGTTGIALKVEDPASFGDKLILPLGPPFPPGAVGPTLMAERNATVISFGKDYTLQLPVGPDGWTGTEPPPATSCVVLAGEGVYLRANFARQGHEFQGCYVELRTGRILSGAHAYRRPPGIRAYAVKWSLLTNEKEPRVILSHPSRTTGPAP